MRIFNAFLIILVAAILFMLPISEAIYDYRTDLRTDTFSTVTAAAVTSANETLLESLYGGDTGSVTIVSDDAADAPLPNSYNATSQVLNITGLTASTTRELEVDYNVDSLQAHDSINTIAVRFPWIWLLLIIAFGPAALISMLTGRN